LQLLHVHNLFTQKAIKATIKQKLLLAIKAKMCYTVIKEKECKQLAPDPHMENRKHMYKYETSEQRQTRAFSERIKITVKGAEVPAPPITIRAPNSK